MISKNVSLQFVGVSGDGYVSLLDEEGHMRSDLEVDNNDTVKTLRDMMNADSDTDVTVLLTHYLLLNSLFRQMAWKEKN